MQSHTTGKRGCGCLLNLLIAFVVLVLALVTGVYVVVMHTAWPLRKAAALAERAGAVANLRIAGVSGSLASGVCFTSATWTDGEMADVRIIYSGLMDLVRRKQLILREVHIGKAHFSVMGSREGQKDTASTTNAAPGGASGDWPLKRFQIDRLTLADIVLTNRQTGFSLAIPALEWTGFKAEKGNVIFGQLKADTDRFRLVTKDAPSAEFQRRIEGTLLPKLHPNIRRPITFIADVGCAGGNMTCRVSAFDGKLDFEMKPDHTGSLRCTGLDLADYFGATLPRKLTMEMAVVAGAEKTAYPIEVRGGTFTLGVRTFEIPAQDAFATNLVFAVSREAGEAFRYELVVQEGSSRIRHRLTAQPPLSPQDTLANVFYGKNFSSLTRGEQDDIDGKRPLFQLE